MGASEAEIEVSVTTDGPTSVPPASGRVGGYDLAYTLASGGMATVYVAYPEEAQSPDDAVALKQVHPHLASQRAFADMFLDEARITARIDHPNVARVLDYGAANGSYFLTMELLFGRSLASVMRALHAHPRIDARTRAAFAAFVVAEAAEGLHAAHELRDDTGALLEVVHRDVSPHNLLLTYDGGVRVVDFGIARARGRVHHTETGTVKGKFAYMAPEQMMAGRVDRRADVWSLGVVLFELLSGRYLFRRGNETETVLAVSTHTRVPLELLPEEADMPLIEALDRALEHDPEDRFATALDLSRALRAALREMPAGFDGAELAAWMHVLFPGAAGEEQAQVRRAFAERLPEIVEDDDTPERSAIVRRSEPPREARRWPRLFGVTLAVGVAFGFALTLDLGGPAPSRVRVDEPRAGKPSPAPTLEAPPEEEPATEAAAPAEAAAPDVEPAPEPAPRPVRRARAAPAGRGMVSIATRGGWAEVYLRGRRLGTTPGRFRVPAGRQTLVLRPHGGTETRRVRVNVPAGGTRRLRVDL